jgi:hypothetical protein
MKDHSRLLSWSLPEPHAFFQGLCLLLLCFMPALDHGIIVPVFDVMERCVMLATVALNLKVEAI